jgi:hypothetical protein
MRTITAVLTLLAATLATPGGAHADEVWSLPSGNQIVYDRDSGDTAILTYTPEQGLEKGQIFVVGLAGAMTRSRQPYQAFWTEADDAGPTCRVAITDVEGRSWKRWGLATVTFARADFPSRITIARGECLGVPGRGVVARPVVGAGVR